VTLDRVEVHMGRGCEVYLTPLPGGEVNVAVLFERAPAGVAGVDALLAFGLERHPRAARHLGVRTTPPAARSLDGRREDPLARGGLFAAGDAGRLVDPIVGCGVSIALRTGRLAARAAHARLAGRPAEAVDRSYALAFARECTARRALAGFLRRGDAHPRLARAVAGLLRRMPVATRSMARIAGGV
jgi:flavin-dependent dehydrogenase